MSDLGRRFQDLAQEIRAPTVEVKQPALSSLALAPVPTSVRGGNPVKATVTLTGPAPTGGAVVVLASDRSAATVPATITVSAGSATATFAVATSPVAGSTSVVISARRLDATRTATLTVQPPALLSVAVSPASVTGGTASTGTVTLTDPAPSGGTTVTLSSSNPAIATVPPSITIPAGATTASFKTTTFTVTSSTSATITATYGGASPTASLTVTP